MNFSISPFSIKKPFTICCLNSTNANHIIDTFFPENKLDSKIFMISYISVNYLHINI